MIDIKYRTEEFVHLTCRGHSITITEYAGSFVITITNEKGTSVIHTKEIITDKEKFENDFIKD